MDARRPSAADIDQAAGTVPPALGKPDSAAPRPGVMVSVALPPAQASVEILEVRTAECNDAVRADAMAGATRVAARQQGRQKMSIT